MRLMPPSGSSISTQPLRHSGQFVLGDLIALGQVRVMVVLAREDRRLRDLAVERQPRADRCFDRGAVAHRQRARQPQTDRAGVRIGRRALIFRAAAAEHLCLRQQLRVDFHAHDDVIFLFQLRRLLVKQRSSLRTSIRCGGEYVPSIANIHSNYCSGLLNRLSVPYPLSG